VIYQIKTDPDTLYLEADEVELEEAGDGGAYYHFTDEHGNTVGIIPCSSVKYIVKSHTHA